MEGHTRQDQLFDCLSHRHRRIIIDVLRSARSPKSTFELARDVVAEIRETSNKELPTVDSVQTSLYHSHLPRLTEARLVEYDEKRDVVAPAEFTYRSGILLDVADVIAEGDSQASVEPRDRDDKQVTG